MVEPMTIIAIVGLVISLIGAYISYRNRPQTENQSPGEMGDVPTVDASSRVRVVFGACRLRDPNILWWGDVVRHDSDNDNNIPAMITLGVMAAVGLGKLQLRRLYLDDLSAWSGLSDPSYYEALFAQDLNRRGTNDGWSFNFHFLNGNHANALTVRPPTLPPLLGNAPNLSLTANPQDPSAPSYWDPDINIWQSGGGVSSGGGLVDTNSPAIIGDYRTPNFVENYLRANILNAVPGSRLPEYKNISRVIIYGASAKDITAGASEGTTGFKQPWRWGYLGNSTSVPAINFIVQRFPYRLHNRLYGSNPATYRWRERIGSAASNPAEIVYDMFVSTPEIEGYGLARGYSEMDDESFRLCAVTLDREVFGLALSWGGTETLYTVVSKIMEIVGGCVYFNINTMKWTMRLFRSEFTPAEFSLDTSTIVQVNSMTLTAEQDMSNKVTISFTDSTNAENRYCQETWTSFNEFSMLNVGTNEPQELDYYPIIYPSLARRVAYRELLRLSNSFKSLEVTVLRKAMYAGKALSIGDRIRVNYPPYGLYDEEFRVLSIGLGAADSNEVLLSLSQDLYTENVGQVLPQVDGAGLSTPLNIQFSAAPLECCVMNGGKDVIVACANGAIYRCKNPFLTATDYMYLTTITLSPNTEVNVDYNHCYVLPFDSNNVLVSYLSILTKVNITTGTQVSYPGYIGQTIARTGAGNIYAMRSAGMDGLYVFKVPTDPSQLGSTPVTSVDLQSNADKLYTVLSPRITGDPRANNDGVWGAVFTSFYDTEDRFFSTYHLRRSNANVIVPGQGARIIESDYNDGWNKEWGGPFRYILPTAHAINADASVQLVVFENNRLRVRNTISGAVSAILTTDFSIDGALWLYGNTFALFAANNELVLATAQITGSAISLLPLIEVTDMDITGPSCGAVFSPNPYDYAGSIFFSRHRLTSGGYRVCVVPPRSN
jgi:hypothetical protein